MYPHERSLVEEMKDRPFALIGVNSDELETARKAVADNGLNWRSFQNQPESTERPISTTWDVQGWPTVVVLDAEMRIHYRGHDGNKAMAVARELVDALEGN